MSARVLFDVPNALDTRRPLPLPLGPSIVQFLIVMDMMIGSLLVAAVDLWWTGRSVVPDLVTFLSANMLALLVVSLPLRGHMLPYWLLALNRLSTMRVLGRLSWGLLPGYKLRDVHSIFAGGPPRKGAVFLSARWSHILYENAVVLDDGVLDISGLLLLPSWLRVFLSLVAGRAPYSQILHVGTAALADMEDAEAQANLLHNRSDFWFRLKQQATAYSWLTPLDPEKLAYCAGPEEDGARALAAGQLGQERGLSERHNALVVRGATRWFLARNVKRAQATLEDHGRLSRPMTSEEVNALLDQEWPNRRTPVEINPFYVRVGTRRWVSYLITRLERTAPLDWALGFLDGSIPYARLALHQRPVLSGGYFGALAQLTWRSMAWRAGSVGFDENQYANAIKDAEDTVRLIREPSSLLHRWGIVLTVPIEHKEATEEQLRARYITDDGWRPAFAHQDHAAKASLPIGDDAYVDYASTSSRVLGLSTPWAGGGLWVPPENGKPRAVLIGHSLVTAEPVGWYPFDRKTQEAWNLFCWGQMGDGKTTLLQMLGRRICKPHPNHYLAELKPRFLAIDHKTSLEYGGLVTDLGGQYVVATGWDDVRGLDVEQAALGINISRIHPRQRGKFVYDLMRMLWDKVSKRPILEPWPGVICLDEMHMLALTELGRWMISEVGKMSRDAWFTVMFGTQDMDDVLRRDETSGIGADGLVAAAIKQSPTRIALRQPPMSRHLLQSRLQLSNAECNMLINMGSEDGGEVVSSRGKCIVWAHGRKAPTQAVPLGREREIFAMDPQDRLALLGKGATAFGIGDSDANTEDAHGDLDVVLDGHAANAVRQRRSSVASARRTRLDRLRRGQG